MSTILLPAQLDGYSNRKDKTVALRFITQEQTSEQVAHIHSQIDGFGYLFFKVESEITAAERAELDALQTDLYDNPKTQSRRRGLRPATTSPRAVRRPRRPAPGAR